MLVRFLGLHPRSDNYSDEKMVAIHRKTYNDCDLYIYIMCVCVFICINE